MTVMPKMPQGTGIYEWQTHMMWCPGPGSGLGGNSN